MKALSLALASGLAGAAIVIACSDDSPRRADAATCDCPIAEPPITQARIHRVAVPTTVPTGSSAIATAGCATDEVLLSGGCEITADNTPDQIVIEISAPHPGDLTVSADSWTCRWRNGSFTGTAEVRAQALCLRPAP